MADETNLFLDEALRLADRAQRDGDRTLRDSMLTLAIAVADPDSPWLERARGNLLSSRPGHYLGRYVNARRAIRRPEVQAAFAKIRAKYPVERIRAMRLKSEASSGPFQGSTEPLGAVLERVLGRPAEAENVRRDAPHAAMAPLSRPAPVLAAARSAVELEPLPSSVAGLWSRPDPAPTPKPAPLPASRSDDPLTFYLTVLLGIAMLLSSVSGRSHS